MCHSPFRSLVPHSVPRVTLIKWWKQVMIWHWGWLEPKQIWAHWKVSDVLWEHWEGKGRGRVKEGPRRGKEPFEACLGNYQIASLFKRQQTKEPSNWLVLEQLYPVCCFGSRLSWRSRQESLWKLEVAGLTLTRRKKGSGSNKRKLKEEIIFDTSRTPHSLHLNRNLCNVVHAYAFYLPLASVPAKSIQIQ